MEPTYFATADEFRAWLEAHHDTERELWVGMYKVGTDIPSMRWPEAVDQALCFGWIDGIRKGIDDQRYMNRFTPRKPDSNWSAVNLKRVEELIEAGLMHPAGLRVYEARKVDKERLYAYEQRHTASLDAAAEAQFRANPQAWAFWEVQPPHYRKAALWWIHSAKKEETRQKRLDDLIAHSAEGRTVPPLTPRKRK